MSTRMVPNFLPRLKAKSSIPSSDTCPTGPVGSAIMHRRMVILLVCMLNRSVTRTPASPTSSKAKDLDDLIQTLRHTRPRLDERGEALYEDFPRTRGCITKQFPHEQEQAHPLPTAWQIRSLTGVAAMHAGSRCATQRAARGYLG